MSEVQPVPGPPKSTPAPGILLGIATGLGIGSGATASKMVRPSLGWWGSLGAGMLGAVLIAWIVCAIRRALGDDRESARSSTEPR